MFLRVAPSAAPNGRHKAQLIRKSGSYCARGSTRRSAAERSRVVWRVLSGGAFEDDGVAQGFELADVVAAAALGVDAAGVVPGAEVGVAGLGVGQ